MATTENQNSMEIDVGHDAGPSGITINIENGHNHDLSQFLADGEVSPTSLRRSTRASALKAQEKLKFKEGMGLFPEINGTEDSQDSQMEITTENDDILPETKRKRPRLLTGKDLDQYDCKFGIKMEKDDVYFMSDESEISSLNEEEVEDLRKKYDYLMKSGVSKEQQFEREIQIKQLEAQLRMEENKLVMLKKTIQNQKDAELEQMKKQKMIAEASQRQQAALGAYKAPVVSSPSSKMNGTTPKSSKPGRPANVNLTKQAQDAIMNMDPAGQKAFIQKLIANPVLAQQAQTLIGPQLLQYLQQQQHNQNLPKSSSTSALSSLGTNIKKEVAPPAVALTPAQRANEARKKLRQHLDQQLLALPPPKSVINEINFIPQATNDFCYLLGLDLTVQRVLKDKNVFKRCEEKPYECEECGTDFTPSWKAIGTDENDLHLYCEQCVRQAQKKKIRADHAQVYKKALAKVAEQEKELEKQIQAGKFDEIAIPTPPPPPPPIKRVTTPTPAVTPKTSASSGNLPNVSVQMAAALQLIQQQQKKAAAVAAQPSTSSQSSKSSQNVQAKTGTKRPASSSTSNATVNSSPVNQQQLLMNMIRQNPMLLATMMSNASNQQLWGNLLSNSGGNRSNTAASGTNSSAGTMALLQAFMQQQQQNSSQANSTNNAAVLQQLAMMNNPFLAQMMAMQTNNMRNFNSTNKSRK